MFLGYSNLYPADDFERLIPDAYAAQSLIEHHRPDIPARIEAVLSQLTLPPEEHVRYFNATMLGLARLGLRHGGFGNDQLAYHNEEHVLDLVERPLSRLMTHLGTAALPSLDWACLMLFAACHDLHQRVTQTVPGPIGSNEAASIAECFRILDACGFLRDRDRPTYIALELMIAGSTFDPQPTLRAEGDDIAIAAGGSLARALSLWLDSGHPGWSNDPAALRGEWLCRLAADLDTGNVSESFDKLSDSALRLCREREQRAGRPLDTLASGAACLSFLTRGQLSYFFDLHRFASREGRRVLEPLKWRNAEGVQRVSALLIARFVSAPPPTGQAVMDAFAEISAAETATIPP